MDHQIKIGSIVKVLRSTEFGDPKWGCEYWNPKMTDYIGHEFEVRRTHNKDENTFQLGPICKCCNKSFKFNSNQFEQNFWFPHFVLLAKEEEKYQEPIDTPEIYDLIFN